MSQTNRLADKCVEARAERPKIVRMGHVAIPVSDVATAARFYREVLGLDPAWRLDPDFTLLRAGGDDLALLRAEPGGRLQPHCGFRVPAREDVDRMAEVLAAEGVRLAGPVRDHRDGSRSLYFYDPDGNVLEILWDPENPT